MSLLVWLPLIKDNHNQGLLNLTPTNQGTVSFIDGGKFGKCMSANTSTTSSNGISYPGNLVDDLGTQFSCSVWIKVLGNHHYYNGAIVSSGDWNKTCWSLSVNQDNTKIDVFSKGYTKYINYSIPLNTWIHICCVSDNGVVTLYVNGEYVGKRTESATLDSSASNFCVGKVTYGNYFGFNGNINDLRIYDHALSLKEVKELSKGLMCHYLFNGYGSQENLFSWQNKGNQVINLNAYQNVGSFGQLSNCLTFDPSTTVGTKYTISFWARSPNGSTSLRLYNSNGSPRWFYFSTTLSSSLGAEWQYFTYTFTNADRGSGTETASIVRRIEIYMPSQTGGQVKNIKIEVGDVATGWSPGSTDSMYSKLGYDSTTVYDSSGYNYHCTLSGTLSNNVDTPRNTISIYFNGTAQITRESITSEVKSVSFWIKANKTATTVAFSDARSKIAFGFNGGKHILTGCSGRSVYFHYATTFTDNVWHHVAIIKTSSTDTDDVYIDGEFVEIGTVKDHFTHQTDIFCMTGRSYSAPCKMSCYISDFRMYATALSLDDVKALYEAPVSVSDHGEIFTQGEFIEV